MAKKDIEEDVIDEQEAPVAGSRAARWKKHLAEYKVKNPVKFASKEANGEFKSIPDTFA